MIWELDFLWLLQNTLFVYAAHMWPYGVCACTCVDYNNIGKFLNRILGMEVQQQNALFQYFADTLTAVIQNAKKNGRYDMGILGKKWEATTGVFWIIIRDYDGCLLG